MRAPSCESMWVTVDTAVTAEEQESRVVVVVVVVEVATRSPVLTRAPV